MDSPIPFYQKKYTSAVAYLVGSLLFLLPFVEIKCNKQPFAQNTGVGLAFGLDYKVSSSINSLNAFDDSANASTTTKEEGKMYVLALVALLLGATGLLLSIGNRPWHNLISILGIAAALCMIALMVQVNADVNSETQKGNSDGIELDEAVKVSVVFTLWYYLSMIAFVAAAFLSWKKKRLNERTGISQQKENSCLFEREEQTSAISK